MKRQLIAVVTGATLVLTACGGVEEAGPTTADVTTQANPSSAGSTVASTASASLSIATSHSSTTSIGTTPTDIASTSTTTDTSAAVTSADSATSAAAPRTDPGQATAAPSTEVEPGEVDENTVAAFDRYCSGAVIINDSRNRLTNLEPDFSDIEISKADYSDLLGEIANGYSDFSADLTTQTPPTTNGGEEFHTSMVNGFADLGSGVLGAANSFDATNIADEGGYNVAVLAAKNGIDAGQDGLYSSIAAGIGDLDEATQASVRELSSCLDAFTN